MSAPHQDRSIEQMEDEFLRRMDQFDSRRRHAVSLGWAVFVLGGIGTVWGTRYLPADWISASGNASSFYLFYWFVAMLVVAIAADLTARLINAEYDHLRLFRDGMGTLAFGGFAFASAPSAAAAYHGDAAVLAVLAAAIATWLWFKELTTWHV